MGNLSNILLIVCDQLSAQALATYGNTYSNAPNINDIASRGAYFDTAFTNCPLCQPARAAFWTGKYPHQTGVLSNESEEVVRPVSKDTVTLGSLFQDAGYTAVHFGKTHDAGGLRGFDCEPMGRMAVDAVAPAWPVTADTEYDRYTRRKVVDFLENYAGQKPYLAVADMVNPHQICSWVGAFQANHPLIPPPTELPTLPSNLHRSDAVFQSLPLPVQYLCCAHNRQAQAGEWGDEKFQHYLCAYHHYVSLVDAEIGLILDAMHEREDADQTLVVFMSDHGDSMAGRGMVTKHATFYEETMRIPLAFSGPGIAGTGRAVKGLVSLIDLLPTLCDYAGISTPEYLPGTSLMPLLSGETPGSTAEYVVGQWYTEFASTVEPGRMIRTERYKYTQYREHDAEEFYDLQSDPGEINNLVSSPECQDELERHRAILRDHCRETKDPFFSLDWKADSRWRSHTPGYCHHRGMAAPQAVTVTTR